MRRVALFLALLVLGHMIERPVSRVYGQVLPLSSGRSGGSGTASSSGSNGDIQVKSGLGFGIYGGASCTIAGQFVATVSTAGALTCATPSGSAVSTAGTNGDLQTKNNTTLAAYAGSSCSISGQVATVISSNGAVTCATPTTVNTVANTSDGTLLARSGVYAVSGYAGSSCSIAGQFVDTVSTAGVVTCATPSGASVSGTTNTMAKFTSASAIGNSQCTDNGVTVACTGTVSATNLTASSVTTNGTGASITMTNVTGASTPASGSTAFYADSTKKRLCGINDAGTVNCYDGTRGLEFEIGSPGGTALTTAYTTVVYKPIPFACTIAGVSAVIDAGTITVKFLKVASGTATPAISNSIVTQGTYISTGTATSTTSTADFTTTTVTANDIMGMYVSAVSTAAYVNAVVKCNS